MNTRKRPSRRLFPKHPLQSIEATAGAATTASGSLLSFSGTGAFSLTFDQAGNTLTLPSMSGSSALSLSATYDGWHRLVATSDGSTLVNYSYDGEGRRLSKSTTASATNYYLAGQQVVETSLTPSGSGASLQYQYVWSPRYIDAPILRDDFIASPARIYYLDDANFNVTTLTGSDGGVLERVVYSAYGAPTFYNATWTSPGSATSSYSNAILFTGRDLDAETGLYYYRARYYSGGLGRFLSRDPVEAESNVYRYVHNKPVILADPTGLAQVLYKFDNPNAGVTQPAEGLQHPAIVLKVWDDGKLVNTVYSWEGGGSSDSSTPGSSKSKTDRNGWNIIPLDDYLKAHKDRDIYIFDVASVNDIKAQTLINIEIGQMELTKAGSYNLWHKNCASQTVAILNKAGAHIEIEAHPGGGIFPRDVWNYFKYQNGGLYKEYPRSK